MDDRNGAFRTSLLGRPGFPVLGCRDVPWCRFFQLQTKRGREKEERGRLASRATTSGERKGELRSPISHLVDTFILALSLSPPPLSFPGPLRVPVISFPDGALALISAL
ncbi:hypothetical protein X777_07514 [Ooceraea biroi]|uniref:Uncharacterized protein n=1 Tax=Ooceraea biroi TaxID=2015173 RepID=A0A026X5I4_OOCBI|nr:hypothetical protein X777_07514 [Ooceraea biroi]